MTPYQLIKRPVITEKSTELQGSKHQYVFEVSDQANKIEIRKAIEMAFGVRVTKVQTMVVRGDIRRVGKHMGRRAAWKKAIVTLNANDSINFYGEEE